MRLIAFWDWGALAPLVAIIVGALICIAILWKW